MRNAVCHTCGSLTVFEHSKCEACVKPKEQNEQYALDMKRLGPKKWVDRPILEAYWSMIEHWRKLTSLRDKSQAIRCATILLAELRASLDDNASERRERVLKAVDIWLEGRGAKELFHATQSAEATALIENFVLGNEGQSWRSHLKSESKEDSRE